VNDYEVLVVDDSDDDASWHAPLLQRLVCYKQ
jgi:hypothetical protein